MDDAINQLQDLYKSFKNLECIEIHKDSFTLVVAVDDGMTEEESFTADQTVGALQWLEEKHGIKSE